MGAYHRNIHTIEGEILNNIFISDNIIKNFTFGISNGDLQKGDIGNIYIYKQNPEFHYNTIDNLWYSFYQGKGKQFKQSNNKRELH